MRRPRCFLAMASFCARYLSASKMSEMGRALTLWPSEDAEEGFWAASEIASERSSAMQPTIDGVAFRGQTLGFDAGLIPPASSETLPASHAPHPARP